MKTSDFAGYSKLVDHIYGAGFNPALWPEVVEDFRVRFGGSAASLYTMDPASLKDAWFVSKEVGPGAGDDYCRFHPHRNPHREWRKRIGMPVNFVFTFTQVTPKEEFERTDIYQHFYRKYDIRDCAVAVLGQGTRGTMGMAVLFDRFNAANQKPLLQELTATIPHLNRALSANQLLAERNLWQGLGLAAIENLSDAVLVVSQDLRLVHANPAGAALLARNEGLTAPRGRLEAATPAATGVLLRAVGQAFPQAAGAGGAEVALPRLGGGQPLQAQVLPVSSPLAFALQQSRPAALLIVHQPNARPRGAEERLARHFGLTETEGDVLAALVEGATPKEIAARFQVTVRAVRFHLSNLFAKTGTTRQADLVRAALTHLGAAPAVH